MLNKKKLFVISSICFLKLSACSASSLLCENSSIPKLTRTGTEIVPECIESLSQKSTSRIHSESNDSGSFYSTKIKYCLTFTDSAYDKFFINSETINQQSLFFQKISEIPVGFKSPTDGKPWGAQAALTMAKTLYVRMTWCALSFDPNRINLLVKFANWAQAQQIPEKYWSSDLKGPTIKSDIRNAADSLEEFLKAQENKS